MLTSLPLIRATFVLAWTQAAVGLLGVAVAGWTGREVPAALPGWVLALQMMVFGAASAYLAFEAKGDDRVLSLAAVFAVVATAFSRKPLLLLIDVWTAAAPSLEALRGLRVDAFLPFFVWRFFRDFPRGIVSRAQRRILVAGLAISLGAGAALFVANAALVYLREVPAWLQPLDAYQTRTAYWAIVYGLTLAVSPFALWKARSAAAAERRRAVLFATGLVAAALPICLFVMAEVFVEPFAAWLQAGGNVFLLPVVEVCILSVPLTTAYAIIVDRVLPVRVLLRQALQFNLARLVVSIPVAAPFAWMAWAAYRLRRETLGDLLMSPQFLFAAAAIAIGGVAYRLRREARDLIDRAFFREAYDARQILRNVAERSQRVDRVGDWADLIASEVDRALHVDDLAVMVIEPPASELIAIAGRARPLPRHSALAELLAARSEPLRVDLTHPEAPLRTLSESDRHWLADGHFRLLVPVRSSGQDLIGLLCLGEKRSELPFSSDDRELLAAVAASASISLEYRLRLGSRGHPASAARDEQDLPALICEGCGVLAAAGDRCEGCAGRLSPALLPLVPLGKFRLERRVGVGSMGVVYRATDLALGRTVAVKTLPAGSPEDAIALRLEARAMASVVHTNLATIFSAESWMGTPMLVTEFFDGGTLASLLEVEGPLRPPRIVAFGETLALALACLHDAGILHRDVKPSNIGLTASGTAKLLDFGLARLLPGSDVWNAQTEHPDVGWKAAASRTGLAGTPLYMSPEALRGDPPDVSFDLWGLAVVLFEAITGFNPIERPSWRETHRAIETGDVPDLRRTMPEIPPSVPGFFSNAMNSAARHRPQSAREFVDRWRDAWAPS